VHFFAVVVQLIIIKQATEIHGIDSCDHNSAIDFRDSYATGQEHADARVNGERVKQKLEITEMYNHLRLIFTPFLYQAVLKSIFPDNRIITKFWLTMASLRFSTVSSNV